MGLAFFCLTYDIVPQARTAIFTQIHEIIFYGKGGYDWHTVYNMPIWLRRFTFNQILNHYTKEKEAVENQGKNKAIGKIMEDVDMADDVVDEKGNVTKKFKPGKDVKWSFDANRVLELDIIGVDEAKKQSLLKEAEKAVTKGEVKLK